MYTNLNIFPSAISHVPMFGFWLLIIIVWSLIWKGWALWLAARRHEKVWFVVLLIVNTFGILEIIYIFAVAKQKDVKTAAPKMPLPNNTPDQPKQ